MKKLKVEDLFLFLPIFFPILYFPSFYHPTYIKNVVFEITTCGIILIWVVKLFKKRNIQILYNSWYLLLNIFFLTLCLSATYSDYSKASIYSLAKYISLIIWTLFLFQQQEKLHKIKKYLFIGSIFTIVFSLGYIIKNHPDRIYFPLGNPNTLGAFLIYPIIVVIENLFKTKNKKDFLYGSSLLVLAGIVFSWTQSRSASLCLIIGVIVFLSTYLKVSNRKKIFLVLFILGGICIILYYPFIITIIKQNYSVRYFSFLAGIRMFLDSPIIGHGIGTFFSLYPSYTLPESYLYSRFGSYLASPHNYYIEILTTTGIIGFIVFVITVWGPILKKFLFEEIIEEKEIFSVLVSWSVFIGISVSMDYWFFPFVFFSLLAIYNSKSLKRIEFFIPFFMKCIIAITLVIIVLIRIKDISNSIAGEIQYKLAREYFSIGDYQQSLNYFKKSYTNIRIYSLLPVIKLYEVRCYLYIKKTSQVYKSLLDIQHLCPYFQMSYKLLGFYVFRHKSKLKGIKIMIKELLRNPYDFVFRAQILERLRNVHYPLIQKLHQEFSSSIYKELLILYYFSIKDYKKMYKLLLKIKSPRMFFKECLLGEIFLEKRMYKKSLSFYSLHIQKYPLHLEGYIGALKIYSQTSDRENLKRIVNFILDNDIEARNIVAYEYISRIMVKHKLWKEVIKIIKKIIYFKGADLCSYLNLLSALFECHQYDKALRLIKKIRQIYGPVKYTFEIEQQIYKLKKEIS